MFMNGRNIWEYESSSTMSETPNINAIKISQQQLIDKLKILEDFSEDSSTMKATQICQQFKKEESLILEASSEGRSTMKATQTDLQLKEGENLILEDSTIWVLENRFELLIAKIAGEGSVSDFSVSVMNYKKIEEKMSKFVQFCAHISH